MVFPCGAMRLAGNADLRAFREASDAEILDATSEAFTVGALRGALITEAKLGVSGKYYRCPGWHVRCCDAVSLGARRRVVFGVTHSGCGRP